MATCPNINSEDYKKLENSVGTAMAHYYWNKFDGFDKYTVDSLLNQLSSKYSGYEVKVVNSTSNNISNIKDNKILINSKFLKDKEELYKTIESLDVLDSKYGLNLNKIKDIITNEADMLDFLAYKQISKLSNPNNLSKEDLDVQSTIDALNKIRADITKVEFKDKTINDIKLAIQNSIDKVKSDRILKDKSKITKIENFQKLFENTHDSEKPKLFIDYHHRSLIGDNTNIGFISKLDDIIKKAKGAKTKEELRNITRDLVYYYNYAEELEKSFEEIDKDLINISSKIIIDAEKGSTLNKLTEINQARAKIIKATQEILPEILADTFLPYVSSKAQEKIEIEYQSKKEQILKDTDDKRKLIRLDKLEEQFKDMRRDKESLIKAFKAFKDQSILEYLTSPTISSSDPLLSLFAKFVKDKFEEFRLTLNQFEKKVNLEFNKFKKYNKGNLDNVKEYNKDLYELVNYKKLVTEIDENGISNTKLADKQYYSFVNKYDLSKYNNSFNNMLFEANIILVSKGEKASNEFKFLWYKENTEARTQSEIQEIIDSYEKELSKQDFEDWKTKNIRYNKIQNIVEYRGELSQPKLSKYLNPKYSKIQSISELKQIYDFMVKSHLESQQMLPISNRIGMKLPSVPKSSFEKLIEKGLVSSLKDWHTKNFKKSEIDYDIQSRDNAGKLNKTLPINYTNNIPLEDVSLDLIESTLKFRRMALKFKTVFDIKNEVKAASIVANSRTVEMVDPKGLRYLSNKAKIIGIDKYLEDSDLGNSAKWMEAFIDMQIYNKMKNEEYVLGVRADKIGDFMMKHTSFTSIGIPNIMKSVVNNLQANMQIAIESWSGEFLNYKDLIVGRHFYASKLSDMSKDIGKPINESFINQLVEVFDPLQGEWLDTYGNKVSGSTLLRHFNLGVGYALQKAGEHQAQVSMLFGMMNTIKLNHNGTNITLLEAFEKKQDGTIGLKDGIDNSWNPFIPVLDDKGNIVKYEQGSEFKEFVNKVHAINKRLHGVYNSFDKATIERDTAGRLMNFFRKFVVSGIKKRFKNLGVDEELGNPTEGTYRTLYNSIINQRTELIKFLTLNENNLTDFQRNNIKRSLIELTFISAIFLLSKLLNGYDDDDDSYAYNFIQYEAYRLSSEMQFYLNPVEFYRVLRTPTVATTKLEQSLKFAHQIGFPIPYNFEKGKFFINEDFDKNVGEFTKKGDNKAYKYGLDVLGLNLNNQSPEYSLKMLEKLTNK